MSYDDLDPSPVVTTAQLEQAAARLAQRWDCEGQAVGRLLQTVAALGASEWPDTRIAAASVALAVLDDTEPPVGQLTYAELEAERDRLAGELYRVSSTGPAGGRNGPARVECRRWPTRRCPAVYEGGCGDRPCARFESDSEEPWLAEVAAERERDRLAGGVSDDPATR